MTTINESLAAFYRRVYDMDPLPEDHPTTKAWRDGARVMAEAMKAGMPERVYDDSDEDMIPSRADGWNMCIYVMDAALAALAKEVEA